MAKVHKGAFIVLIQFPPNACSIQTSSRILVEICGPR